MRVTTDFWVSALLRRVFSAGGFGAVVRRGAAEAGAVFVFTRDRFGMLALYGPAPQTSYETGQPDERRFVALAANDQTSIDRQLDKETRFDPDVWVVEIEAGETKAAEFIEIADS